MTLRQVQNSAITLRREADVKKRIKDAKQRWVQGLPNSGVPWLFASGAHLSLLLCMCVQFSSKLKYPWASYMPAEFWCRQCCEIPRQSSSLALTAINFGFFMYSQEYFIYVCFAFLKWSENQKQMLLKQMLNMTKLGIWIQHVSIPTICVSAHLHGCLGQNYPRLVARGRSNAS